LGQVTRGDAQVVLLDLPGIVGEEHHRNPRHGAKVAGAWAAAAQCDVVLFIVDAFRQVKRPDPRVERLLTEARGAFERARYASATGLRAPPSVLALNKVDLFAPGDAGRASLKALARRLATPGAFERLFPVSAKLGRGVEGVLEHLLERAPVRPWDLDPDEATDASDAERAIEVVRECVYRRVHQELPYNVVPLHESWERFRDGSAKIEQILVVDSVGAKQILVGRRGSTIGQIGIRARVILEELFGHRVHLVLHVKVRKKNNNSLRGRARTEAFQRY
jgi:GTP-binding protein Era